MQQNGSLNLADWFGISLRWITLLGLGVFLVPQGALLALSGVALLAAGFWNFALMVFAILNHQLVTHRGLILTIDLLVANLLLLLSGGLDGGLGWAGLLPVFSAALYFDVR